jgi:glycosyltransferase involved in cell wall biosynthesis
MTERIVLIFAYHFPPENAAGGARPYRFYKFLSRLGYNCRVFTASEQAGRNDPNIEHVPDPFVTHPRRNLSWQLERALRKFVLPGEVGMQWSYRASQAARKYMRAHSGASVTIFSSFPPLGSHLAGWQLARNNGFSWIADFRDPLIDESRSKEASRFRKQCFRWLERITARRADAVIANTDMAVVEWQKKFPTPIGRIHLIWNGFDPEERVSPLPLSSGDGRVLSHAGDLYGGRSATPILESIARLIAAGRLPAGSVCVRLIGTTVASALPNREFLGRARAEGWLDLVTERIPQREALQIARSSDFLLLLQPQSTTQVPGKLFEYLQIGRPILAFLQAGSPAERLLERSGVPYRCIHPGSLPEATDDTLAEFFRLPSTSVAANSWFEEQFNAVNQTRALDAIIRSLHEEPMPEASRQNDPQIVAGRSPVSRAARAIASSQKAPVDLIDRI